VDCFFIAFGVIFLGGLLFAVGFGCVLTVYGVRRIAEGCRAAHWPYTTGTVLGVESKAGDEATREVVVRYSYTVGGETYEGTRVHPAYTGGRSDDEKAHEGLEAVLAAGKKVRVYYRGDRPATSTLAVGFFSCSLALVFGGFIFAAMPAGLLVMAAYAAEDGTAESAASQAGAAVAGFGFLLSWSLTMWFTLRGNRNFASGITVEE
jgi:hypothetical protein